MTYEAGVGLSGARCDASLSPEALGRAAAAFEFERNVRRLTDAGIPVSAINVDGPMLRLLPDSDKPAGCRETAGAGFDVRSAGQIVHAYMVELRDRIEAAQEKQTVQVRWLVNLPLWQVGRVPRNPVYSEPTPDAKPTTDLTDAVRSLAKAQAEQELPGRALEIAEVVIGYPYSMGKQNPNRYAIRVRNLWLSSRALNPRSGHPPPLGFIVNTHSYLNPLPETRGQAGRGLPDLPPGKRIRQ